MRTLRALLVLLLIAAPALAAQQSTVAIPVGLQLGIPQGEFAQNVNFAGGVGGGVLWKVGGPIALRADLGFLIYGSETRRVPLGGGALGLINVDVSTTNSIFGGSLGGQIGVPGRTVMPYLGGSVGFSAFTTSSSVRGSNSSDEPFASSTNSNDGTFAKTAFGGLYIPFGEGTTVFDLGVRHTWNGENVRYLTPGDITEDGSGNVILNPRQTRADFLTVFIGITFTPGTKSPQK
ncbi:MAG: hypothetical protein IPJ78_12870 [Gemmatimonadetes bacterium]|jgi:hypothetical protein|nr:hypothetical protein [Gemmatimonadota bacterium]